MSEDPGAISGPAGRQTAAARVVFISDHQLIRLIGEGSYGEVWLARNTLGTYRAIKVVHENTFRDKKPFEREFNGVKKFEPISRLHEGLMDILQVGRDDGAGYFYCVMELADDMVSGQLIDPDNYTPRTLAQDIAKHKRLPVSECRHIGLAIASALDFLHRHNLIHRDVKPSNIVFVNGAPKLADIGLVAEATEARSYVGTEGFIPPEGPGTVQADIYSFGKVLYEISTGKDRHDYPELPTHLGDAILGQGLYELNQVILKACRPEARRRYKRAAEIVEDLQTLSPARRTHFQRFQKWCSSRFARAAASVVFMAGISWLAISLKGTPAKLTGLPAGLVSAWSGENSTADSAGQNNGTIAGWGNVKYAPGVVGQAFVLDGIHRDRIDLGNPVSLRLQDFTIASWIKRSNPTNISRDDEHEDDTPGGEGGMVLSYGLTGYGFGFKNDGRLALSAVGVGGVMSTNRVADTLWHHVAVTKSGSNIVFYLDGVAASGVVSCDATFYFDSPVAIGSLGSPRGCSFWGMIDELKVFKRALADAEIRSVYDRESAASQIAPEGKFVPPRQGLVEWWSAEGDAKGIHGKYIARMINGAGFAVGKAGRAFRFNGRNQCILIPRTSDLDVGNQLTMGCWVKLDPDNHISYYQGLVSSEFYDLNLSCGYSSHRMGLNFGLSTDNGNAYSAESYPDIAEVNGGGAVITAGEWHHVVGTYDGARIQLYIDGQPWGKPIPHSGPISPMPPGALLAIGSEDGAVMPGRKGRYFKGLIDEAFIYRRALSIEEIDQLYKAGSAGMSACLDGNVR